jgi:hypothetical protein
MKRSERFFSEAKREALLAIMFSVMCVAGCVWSVRVGLDMPSGGVVVFALSLIGLIPAATHARECDRLLRVARREAQYEYTRSIRPRI